jgi:hypothetical protein
VNIGVETIGKALEYFLYGISIPFRFLDMLLPDELEIALLILGIIITGYVGIRTYLRKIYDY